MKARPLTFAAIAALLSALTLGATGAAARAPDTGPSAVSAIAVSGTFTDAEGAGTFTGTLDIDRFVARDGALYAIGTIDGTLTGALGTTRSVADQPVRLPVNSVTVVSTPSLAAAGPITTQQVAQDCQILHLEFGGITLNILGIEVQLSPIVLDINLGGLLGGILCGLLGALGGGAPAPAQANMLNQALGLP
jgi:hypothetical protein